jgi:DNA repair ATPase RecN
VLIYLQGDINNMELIKKFLNNIKKNKFEEDFEKLVSNSVPKEVKIMEISFEISQIMDKLEFPKNSLDFDEVDSYFVKLIENLKEFYEGKREKLGKEIMKSKNLIELNQLTYSIEKNKQLLYREVFNLEEYLRFQKILLDEIKKL